jgi:hypothetical protein
VGERLWVLLEHGGPEREAYRPDLAKLLKALGRAYRWKALAFAEGRSPAEGDPVAVGGVDRAAGERRREGKANG